YGADALRLAISFLGPYEDTYPWNENGMKATARLIETVFNISDKISDKPASKEIISSYNLMVKNVTSMAESLKFNTAVSELMIFTNKIKNDTEVNIDVWKGFLKILAPFAPFISEELWQKVNQYNEFSKQNSIHLQEWPKFDEDKVKQPTKTIAVQVNGRIRGEIELTDNETEETVRAKALQNQRVGSFVANKHIIKFIYVPYKIVSILTD
ncbi:class I tRNA ligase family protein, partial [candidate division WWE3 bacterium]|nr:class I tRNA ligase family protein [candidate division WWE3 bacterium]